MTGNISLAKARGNFICLLSTHQRVPQLKELLARALTLGLWGNDPFVAARLVGACADSGDLALAQLAFAASRNPTAFSYTTLLRAVSAGPDPAAAFLLFRGMLRSGLHPDCFTFPFLLRACGRCCTASSPAHAIMFKHGLERHTHAGTALLHAYAACGQIESSLKVFDEMPQRTIVTWNAAIFSCARYGAHEEGLALISEMLSGVDAEPNVDTMVATLSCSAIAGSLLHGKCLHSLAMRRGADTSLEVSASLIFMYAKCGNIGYATKVFDSVETKDVVTWTAMIGGLALQGLGEQALTLFKRMVDLGPKPDSLAFTSILHACSHCGLVEDGIRLFNSMGGEFGLEARMEHYGAIIDLFGRAGHFEEAEKIIKSMPFKANLVIWGSLFHASVVHARAGWAYRLGDQMMDSGLLDEEGGFFVGFSNVLAKGERWDEVGRVRHRMLDRGMKKERGFSIIEVDRKLHKFLVGDARHPSTREIHRLLSDLLPNVSDLT